MSTTQTQAVRCMWTSRTYHSAEKLCIFCKLKTQPTLKRTLALLHASSPFDTHFSSWTNPSLLVLKQQVSGLSEKKPDRLRSKHLQEIKPKAAAPNPALKPPQRITGSRRSFHPLKPPPQTLRNQPMRHPAALLQPTAIRTTSGLQTLMWLQ